MLILIIFGVVALIVVGAILSHQAAKKRREAMTALANRLGLMFQPDKDYGIDEQYPFLGKLQQGSNHYAFNRLSGTYRDHPVHLFDFHYETHSTDSKGRRQTHHHYFSFFVLRLGRSFPECTIGPEGIFSKLAQSFGYDDIDFESHEFSRQFCVRSKDKKFAYDFCNARMMEYLLANRDLVIEVEHDTLTIAFNSRLRPEEIEPQLHRLLALRRLMPEYLFTGE